MNSPSVEHSRNRFIPRLEELEQRLAPAVLTPQQQEIVNLAAALVALSITGPVPFPPHPEFIPPEPFGTAVQAGSVLNVSVSNPLLSTTVFLEDGRGDVAVSWNFNPFQFFHGINSIQVNAQGLANAALLFSSAPLQAAEQVNLHFTGFFNAFLEHVPGGAPLTVQANPPAFTIPF